MLKPQQTSFGFKHQINREGSGKLGLEGEGSSPRLQLGIR